MSTVVPARPAAVTPSSQTQWKQRLEAGRAAIRAAFEAQPSPTALFRKHGALIDGLLREIWREHELPASLALVAVGGYGRGQLFPHSDIDLLILLGQPADHALEEKLQRLIGSWWDIGLETGHSVRTIAQCVDIALQDISAQTNMLEPRFLAGNRALYKQFIGETLKALDALAFMQAKRLEQRQRHARHEETNLEPNVKESAGGLRDLHHILWVARAGGFGKSWHDLARRGVITDAESRDIQRHERLLHLLRIRLHYLAGRREDRLIFDVQSALARQFGLANREHRLASEQLMQRYYRSAKAVSQIDDIVRENLRSRLTGTRNAKLLPLDDSCGAHFGIRNEVLAIRDDDVYEKHPQAILETFLLLQKYPEIKGIGANTLRALWRARKRMGSAYRNQALHREQFLNILRGPARVMRELRRMNQLGILGAYLPAFGNIAGQMQHDLYHVYTVDEHILRVIRNLRRFAVAELVHEFPLCSRLMSDFGKPEVLYLAALFHDIAKGRGGDHSTLGKADAARFCKAHGLSAEDGALVEWLVEQHLMMSATAQKQDLSDPDVIQAFAAKVQTERRLIALYLLTVADIRGTSPKVWNAWKGKLLEDLFLMTQRRLAGQSLSPENSQRTRQDEARALLRLYAIADEAIDQFWGKLDTAYFLRHEPQEIAWHTRTLYYRPRPEVPVIKARPSRAGEGLQVMVYAPDQEELFARICGFFESIRYNIQEARIYTAPYRYALDTFQVQDPDNANVDYRDLTAYIEHELGERLRLKAPLPPLTRPRLNRQLRHFPISPEVNIQKDERGTYQVLSIIAGDRPGLLSRIARIFVAYGINLHTAKINTLGARAEDTFLITGDALTDPKTVVRMENELIETLKV
ncbi:MAG: [protein-PII] uridylyltransferase [Betaproteobacteria bacterium]|nr:[protein-PII] uridylyltransferase [Betaproteobacteria bacterium]